MYIPSPPLLSSNKVNIFIPYPTANCPALLVISKAHVVALFCMKPVNYREVSLSVRPFPARPKRISHLIEKHKTPRMLTHGVRPKICLSSNLGSQIVTGLIIHWGNYLSTGCGCPVPERMMKEHAPKENINGPSHPFDSKLHGFVNVWTCGVGTVLGPISDSPPRRSVLSFGVPCLAF